MANLSRDEIATYARSAGFTGDDVGIAVAVAMAESGGNPDAHNTKPPDNSYGLWQINMYGNLGPARRAQFHLASNDALFSPAINARAARGVFQSQGWNGWTTYTTGAYKKFMDKSIGTTVKDGILDATGVSSIAESVNSLGKNIFNGIASITGVIVAIALLGIGFLILARNKLPTKQLTRAATRKVAG
jgi:hypothetical protein